ncbi:DUF2913 family protein [Salmonella enterica subsp. enterica]|nr:DUF2913 family protein [Salmonella enterica subsp. enterica serovar Javiana]EEK7952484.1 DUF2913 family protein [Salmonella enterica subsp. enterica serovar Javiana]EEK7979343.1 DUF2913 family protein [Salmonella enterica subsp. enterica serovar Javiana]EEK8040090.1 DUF2913 family protein [Salmonella enterica subsp. enterica serovar Javiana]EEK8073046.1 DUF2913 family protein [Salmonella enterica subsp. enterica serovar Javiana]
MSVTEQAARSAHLAWCALIALHLARQDGHIHSESRENLFLVRWLAGAEKQRRFSCEVARDITWLLKQGRQSGLNARLRSKLEFFWRAGSGDILAQTDMFRLTWGLDTLKGYRWGYYVLSDTEWAGRRRMRPGPDVNAVSLLQSSLARAFADDGSQLHPVRVRVNGNIAALEALLSSCGWRLQQADDGEHSLLAGTTEAGEVSRVA